MKTQDWQASNAPSGPPMRLRCSCGETLLVLNPGQSAGRAKSDGNDSTACCAACGKSIRLEVRGGK